MAQVISVHNASLLFNSKVSSVSSWWRIIYQHAIKMVIRALEYHSCSADDFCLHRRYFVCPVTGRAVPAKTLEEGSASIHESSRTDGVSQ